MPNIARDLTRNFLALLTIGLLIAASFWVMLPFIAATVWATMIVVASWPTMLMLEARVGGRRWIPVAGITLALLLLLFVPFTLAIASIVDNADRIMAWAKDLAVRELPPPPDWVGGIPLVGERVSQLWADMAAEGKSALAARVAPYVGQTLKWLAGHAGGFGLMFVHFLLTTVLTAILFMYGEDAANWMRRFGRRLAGERGDEAVVLAGQAIRGVALGVGVTAIVQSILGGVGLAIAGVPFASVLTAVMLLFAIAQIGVAPVMFIAVGWLYWKGDPTWGTVLLVWSVIVTTLDNVLRPILIRKGADLPLLLIFAGVIGGLLAFGIIGIFVGPVVLAVTYKLVNAWMDETHPPAGASAAAQGPVSTTRDDQAPDVPH